MRVGSDFALKPAASTYGYVHLRPTRWLADQRVLSLAAQTPQGVGTVGVRTGRGRTLLITGSHPDPAAVARRVLRVDQDLSDFHALCAQTPGYADAATQRFGRLIRSATLFEDVIKTLFTCNTTWRQTVSTIDRLVRRFGVAVTAEAHAEPPPADAWAFPSPERLAQATEAELRQHVGCGYRAPWVVSLARSVVEGARSLQELEALAADDDVPTADLHKQLRQITGVGPYAASNLCMLLGRYERVAYDSEMRRLLKKTLGVEDVTPAQAQAHYGRFGRFAFLAYWFDLWRDYATPKP